MAATVLVAGITAAACTGAATPTPVPTQAATTAPTTAATPTTGATGTPASAAGATVEAKPVGSIGTVLVAGSNGMTVYNFTKDTKDSGSSACTAACLAKWPALTVPAGSTPTAGTGVTGTLGTITRADNGQLQVTYNGLPLYFFTGDSAPGDANGVYTGWVAVNP